MNKKLRKFMKKYDSASLPEDQRKAVLGYNVRLFNAQRCTKHDVEDSVVEYLEAETNESTAL